MKKSVFIKRVQQELDTIKQRATPEEIAKLNFKTFQYDNGEHCIYGQMTGFCDSNRAKKIRQKTLPFVPFSIAGSERVSFSDLDTGRGNTYTPLEQYLFTVQSNTHREIIEYLKGERQSVNLNVI